MEGSHGAFDALGVAVFVSIFQKIGAGGPAHLEVEQAVETGADAIGVVGVFAEDGGVAVIDFAKDEGVFGSGSDFFPKGGGEVTPELVVGVLDGVDAEAVDSDLGDVEGVDVGEFLDEFLVVVAVGSGVDIA